MTPEEIANTFGLSAQDLSLGLSTEPTGFGLSASPAEWNVAPLDSGSWSVLESPLFAAAAPENILQAPVQSEVVSPFGLMSQTAQPAPTQTNTLALQSPQIPPPPTGTIVSPQSEYAPPTSSDGQWVYSGGQWWPNETVSVGLPEEPQAATDPTTLGYEQMVRDAYGAFGRTGMGDAASNIDQAGFDYWLNTLQSGASTPDAFQGNFKTAVFDYMGKNPQDQYSTYVADYLQKNNNQDIAGVRQLYRDVLGRDAEAGGLSNWYQQFGSEISPEERAAFETSAKGELDSRIKGLYKDFLGRDAEAEGVDYWRNQFGSSIDDTERETFRQSAAAEINKAFGAESGAATYFNQNPDVAAAYAKDSMGMSPREFAEAHYAKYGSNEGRTDLNTSNILAGFKYANDLGLTEAGMKKTLGEDVFNTYKTGFADYAKTGIANILADNQLSFDEARTAVKFGRDYGYDAEKLADLTGTDKKVFDAIYKGYDDTTNRIVDSVLGAEGVKTDGDRIERALALQKQYGFTDEDLAKASDYDVKELKAALDPVRNFDADYKKLVEDPNRSDDQMKTFLTTSLQNPFLKQKLGDRLQPALDELNRPPRERILSQIDQQRDVLGDKYYQGVFGNPEKIADVLEKKGVKSLADLGEKEKFRPTMATAQYTSNGVPVQSPDGKNFYRTVDYGEGGIDYIPVDAKDVETTYGKYVTEGDGENSYSAFKPLSEQEQATLKDGTYQEKLGTVVINKRTGEELTDTSHQLAYQSSSGGLKKKKNYLNVNFTKEGVPVLTASSQRAGLGAALQQALPIIAMALPFMLPGIGAAISGALPGAAVAASGATAAIPATLMNTALTQGIIGGGIAGLTGQDVLKGAVLGGIGAPISAGIGSLLPAGMDPNIARAVTGAGTGVAKGVLQGGDFSDLLGQGVLSGLTNYGLGQATKGLNLTPQQLNFATGIAAPLLQGNKISPVTAFGALANAGQQTQRTTR